MTPWPEPSLRHLARMTDEAGIVEHAEFARPRWELGYCTDDAGRALAISSGLPIDPHAQRLATVALGLLTRAHVGDGAFRLRLGMGGRFTDDAPSDDAAGRALLGLGTAAATAPWPSVRAGALELFDTAVAFRSAHWRPLAYAVLGAAEVLSAIPGHQGARRLVADARVLLPGPSGDPAWPWPDTRLGYANALLPHAHLVAATLAGDAVGTHCALGLLDWLVGEETLEGRFSFSPVAGRGRSDRAPAFDQQPIEAWAMADACAYAYASTGDPRWARTTRRAAAWFLGENDVGVPMHDAATGGGYDGLEPRGVNRNQGAESSLAFVATMNLARTVVAQATPALARSVASAASR